MAEDSVEQVEQVNFFPGDEIVEWTCVEKIDEGNFGQVYKVQGKNKEKLAMKIEPNRLDGGSSAIKVEAEILQDLQSHKVLFVPKFFKANRKEKFHWMVMELLSDNLKKLRLKSQDPNTCTTGTWSRIGIQCLHVLKTIHDCGYIHRDLKPANFAMGAADGINSRVLHVLDFGISRKLVLLKKGAPMVQTSKKDPKDYEFRVARRRTQDFKGTPIYASPNAHSFMDLGRVDDLWSLMYMIAEMVQPLPWSCMDDPQQLESTKLASKLKDLFKMDSFDAVEQMLRKCNYYSFPSYELIFKILKSVYDKSGCSWLDPYDWETKQLGSYQRWKALADARPTLFPWEYSDFGEKLRSDPWGACMESRFMPGMELIEEMERKKKKKEGETQTAEAMMTDEAKTPTPVPTVKKEKKEKEKKKEEKKEESKDKKEKGKKTNERKSKDTKEKKKSEDKKEKVKVAKAQK